LIEFSAVAMSRPDLKKTDDMFNRVLVKDHIAVVCAMESLQTGTRIIVANAHIHWDHAYRDVKLIQVGLLMDEVDRITEGIAKLPPMPSQTETHPVYKNGLQIPTIVCGDFNSVPGSGVYEYLSTGHVPPDHPDFMSHMYGRYTSEGMDHRFSLRSAYASEGELSLTNLTPSFRGAIDYIWYSTPTLSVNAVLGDVDAGYLEKVVGFPNAHFPSE
jgi:CCR4-NOT transcription complex subunit 6